MTLTDTTIRKAKPSPKPSKCSMAGAFTLKLDLLAANGGAGSTGMEKRRTAFPLAFIPR